MICLEKILRALSALLLAAFVITGMTACGAAVPAGVKPDRHQPEPAPSPKPSRRIIPLAPTYSPDSVFVSLIIDDCGESIEQIIPFLGIPVPLSFAVLPYHREAAETSRAVSKRGHEAIVHAPMEPENPKWLENDWFLRTGMTGKEITDRLQKAIDAVPTATGINNHMGSRFCADKKNMSFVMTFLKTHGLYYIDSRTTSDTAAMEAAEDAGLRFLSRDVFLDNEDNVQYIDKQIRQLVETARKNRCALGIGHARSTTAAAIMNYVRNRDPDVVFVPAGRLFDLCPVADQDQNQPE